MYEYGLESYIKVTKFTHIQISTRLFKNFTIYFYFEEHTKIWLACLGGFSLVGTKAVEKFVLTIVA